MDYAQCEAKAERLRSNEQIVHERGQTDLAIWLRDSCRCVYCGVDMLQSYEIAFYFSHLDHLLPKCDYSELAEKAWNLVLSCEACNEVKHTWDPNRAPQSAGTGEPLNIAKEDPMTLEAFRSQFIVRAALHIAEQKKQYKDKFPSQKTEILEALQSLTDSKRSHAAGAGT